MNHQFNRLRCLQSVSGIFYMNGWPTSDKVVKFMNVPITPSNAIAVLTFICALAQSFGQGTIRRITFDGSPIVAPGTAVFVQQYYESNMWFRPVGVVDPGNGFVRRGDPLAGGPAFWPKNGTSFIQASGGDSLVFSFVDGSVFDLESIDLAEYSSVVPVTLVRLVGYLQDGSTVTADLNLDGIIDGTGPLADFQTFNFGPEWSGLTRVEMPYDGWSMDNLVVFVPEPGAGTLVIMGTAVIAGRLFRQRR